MTSLVFAINQGMLANDQARREKLRQELADTVIRQSKLVREIQELDTRIYATEQLCATLRASA